MARWEEERGWGLEGDRGRYGYGYGDEGRDDRWRDRWRGEERMGRSRWDELRGGGREELRPGEHRTYAARGSERDEGWGRGRDEWGRGRDEGTSRWGREREDRGAEGWSDEERDRRWSMGGERGGWRSEGERGRFGEGRRDEGWRGEYDENRGFGEGSYGYGRSTGAMGRGLYGASLGSPYGAGGSYGGMPGGGMYGERGYGRGEWGRGESRFGREDERGPFERMGDKMREGWDKMTGKGPKGFRRSDERVRDDVCERIARSGINAENVEVKVERGEVTFTGEVEHRSDKRMLEDLAEDVFGVDEVNNQTRVRREQQQVSGTATGLPSYQQSQAGQTGQHLQTPGQQQQSQTGQRAQPGAGTTTQPGGRH